MKKDKITKNEELIEVAGKILRQHKRAFEVLGNDQV